MSIRTAPGVLGDSSLRSRGGGQFTNFKRGIAKLEDVRKKAGPKGLNDLLAEVQDYSRRTRVGLEEALSRFLPDLSADDLRGFLTELESSASPGGE